MDKREMLLLQEAERKRIAGELHDTTVQDMICLSQRLELILLYMDEDLVQTKLEIAAAREHVKHMISGMRDTIYDLRPLIMDDIGWVAAFERLQDRLSGELLCGDARQYIHFDIDAVDTSDGVTAISIYRIVYEGCQNIIKHSKADQIDVSVKNVENYIKVSIRDNGVGMKNRENICTSHFGLQLMNERVDALCGKMKINSDSFGTAIEIKVPIWKKIEI